MSAYLKILNSTDIYLVRKTRQCVGHLRRRVATLNLYFRVVEVGKRKTQKRTRTI